MSRSFATAGDLIAGGTTALPLTGTLGMWVRPTSVTGSAACLYYGASLDGTHFFQVYSSTDALVKFYAGWFLNLANESRVALVTNPLTLNQWNSIVVTWANAASNAGTISCAVNGVPQGTVSTMRTGLTTTTSAHNIGDYTGTLAPLARMAGVTLWNAVLGAKEVEAFTIGASPLHIRPTALVEYYPIFGLQSPEPNMNNGGGTAGTVTGTTAADHVPVQPFSRRYWGPVAPYQSAPGLAPYYYYRHLAGGPSA